MKYLVIISMFIIGCSKKQDISCMDGYLVHGKDFSAFCKFVSHYTSGIMGTDCYGVTNVTPRAKISRLLIREGWYSKTKCYNADRDN